MSRFKIALVEDHIDTRYMVRIALQDEFDIFDCGTVREMLHFLSTSGCDLILSDISLPEVNGYALISSIRDDPHFLHLPVIAITAHAGTAERDKALAAGFTDYVTKPVDFDSLLSTIRKHLTSGR